MLTIRELRHHFGELEVLRSVSLDLQAGEILCLLGPSGCGKTTLLRLAAGIERCQQGQIEIDNATVANGAEHKHIPPEARRVGMMFQDFALFPHLTVRQNMMFGVRSERDARARWIEATASRMGIGALLDQYPGTLSGGQQQRVALIRALAPNPRALLLDEPFSGLDAVLRADVREQTQTLIRETGIAALMVTHDPEEAMFMADRIAVMNHGRIIQSGTPDDVYFAPRSAFVAGLFGHLNQLPPGHALIDGLLGSRTTDADTDSSANHEAVVFRPDNLQPVSPGTAHGSAATIHSARRLGSEIQLHLETAGDDAGIALLARWPAPKLPRPGDTIWIAIRHPEQLFQFTAPPGRAPAAPTTDRRSNR